MIPWQQIDAGQPGEADAPLTLHRRGEGDRAEWSIRSSGVELMNSRLSGSERALATLAASDERGGGARAARQVLVGGLGLGYTAAAALTAFPQAQVVVAEISAKVIEWNRGPLAHLANAPLESERIEVRCEDVAATLAEAGRGGRPRFDAVLLDVDNGPEALSQPGNAGLYSREGLIALRGALAEPAGRVAFWSAGPSAVFERRLSAAGWRFEAHRISPREDGRGRARHWVWIASAV